MKFHLSTYRNNYSKVLRYSLLVIFISILSFQANTKIPEKYKIETSLPKCKGTDFTKWTDCYIVREGSRWRISKLSKQNKSKR